MEIVQGAVGNIDGDWKSLARAPWVLNPHGCFLRASLIDRMERAGFTPMIAAEIHNMHMQLAFVQSGYGVGLLPARFVARSRTIAPVKVLHPPSFAMHRSVAIVRVAQLGALANAVEVLERGFRQLFEETDVTNSVKRQQRGVRASRRTPRLPK
jgi:DNA-binding transcriptional LysR family regulator